MSSIGTFEDLLASSLTHELHQIKQEYEAKYIEIEDQDVHQIVKRSDFPVMHIKQGKKKRTCQNMNGVLGGSNAFNFLSFVAGVITLIVNVNNNVNNNNNNLNGVNGNANNNQNNNANVNNNAANVILVMPGRRKKRENSCPNENLANVLVQSIQDYHDVVTLNSSQCKKEFLCGATKSIFKHFAST